MSAPGTLRAGSYAASRRRGPPSCRPLKLGRWNASLFSGRVRVVKRLEILAGLVQAGLPRLVDPGNPFGRGVEITSDGRTELTLRSPSPLTGYCILNADSLEEAESLVCGMPIIDSDRIYEAHSM